MGTEKKEERDKNNKKEQRKKNNFSNLLKNRNVRIIIALSLTFFILGIFILAIVLFYKCAFPENPRFILRTLQVESAGWWNNKSSKIAKILNIEIGQTNLFQLDLKQIRKELIKQPGIENASVERVLPDTLRIRLMERIPRAFIGSSNSRYLIDASCVVISRKYCFGVNKDLPVIIGLSPQLKKKLSNGIFMREFLPAVRLIMLTKTKFPEMKIPAVSIKEKGELIFVLYYRNYTKKPYTVRMPNTNIRYFLKILKKAIEQALATGNPKHDINLNFHGNIVFR